jgi:hypothetical protein
MELQKDNRDINRPIEPLYSSLFTEESYLKGSTFLQKELCQKNYKAFITTKLFRKEKMYILDIRMYHQKVSNNILGICPWFY